jgi:hypothetical protein
MVEPCKYSLFRGSWCIFFVQVGNPRSLDMTYFTVRFGNLAMTPEMLLRGCVTWVPFEAPPSFDK